MEVLIGPVAFGIKYGICPICGYDKIELTDIECYKCDQPVQPVERILTIELKDKK
jgi:hypothetical protein